MAAGSDPSALASSAEGIMGYWNGDATLTPPAGTGDWRDFSRLQPDARLVVLQHETAPLFRVANVGGAMTVTLSPAAAAPFLTLTAPTVAHLQAQLPHLRTAADLRAERIGEIMAQMGDMLSFYGSQFNLHPDRKKWTLVLLGAAYQAVIIPEMRLKLHCSLPRPYDLAPQVQPVILTPSHSAYPSGHATEAFAFATVLSALALSAAGDATPGATIMARLTPALVGTPALLPFRLAARIADNRTVAGVHFPVDSAHGALLGLATGLGFVAACSVIDTAMPVWKARGNDWTDYFTLDAWCAQLANWSGAPVTRPGAAPASLLAQLWANAREEWR